MLPAFGTYRLLLAALVAYGHLGQFHYLSGAYSVFGFFVLSGYLMTMALMQNYLGRKGGLRDYALNRFLRIYPMYWLALLLSAVVALCVSPLVLWGEIALPPDGLSWLYNFIIIGPPPGSHNTWRLLSVAWSLVTELHFYMLLPVLLLWRRFYYVWLVVSAGLLVWFVAGEVSFGQRYFSLWGAWPAFAAGSVLYYWRGQLRRVPPVVAVGALAAAVGAMMFYPALFSAPMGSGFYMVLGLNVLAVAALSKQVLHGRMKKLDDVCGALSYPVFLLQLPVGELVRVVLPQSIGTYTMPFFIVALAATLLASAVAHRLVEAPINKLRMRLREG